MTPYLDLRDPKWGVAVQSQGRERGVQSFALHPQFAQAGTPGFGKLYTYTDISNQTPAPDFTTPNATHARTTPCCSNGRRRRRARRPTTARRRASSSGCASRSPITTAARSRSIRRRVRARADFGLLYVGIADGGSGGDPMKLAQNLGSAFGKIFRIDPLGKNGRGGKYGIPAANPFVSTADALPEIFAYGIRNAQRFGWDSKNGAMYMSDIGQNIVEEVSPVTRRREPRLERLGGQLPLRQPAGGEHRFAAQRSEGDLSDRRMGPARSGPAAQQLVGLRRRGRLSQHARSRSSPAGCCSATCRAASCFT